MKIFSKSACILLSVLGAGLAMKAPAQRLPDDEIALGRLHELELFDVLRALCKGMFLPLSQENMWLFGATFRNAIASGSVGPDEVDKITRKILNDAQYGIPRELVQKFEEKSKAHPTKRPSFAPVPAVSAPPPPPVLLTDDAQVQEVLLRLNQNLDEFERAISGDIRRLDFDRVIPLARQIYTLLDELTQDPHVSHSIAEGIENVRRRFTMAKEKIEVDARNLLAQVQRSAR